MGSKINIAIDGFSGGGKSTTAKLVAESLGYIFINSGSMYRAVTLYFMAHEIPVEPGHPAVEEALSNINLEFRNVNPGEPAHIFLNGVDVEGDIRGERVSGAVSPVAAIPEVRRAMVIQQRRIGEEKGVVMEGRDIGTVVFPDAELKIFLTASIEARVLRRQKQLAEQGKSLSLEEVRENLEMRDHLDSTRADSPLLQAEDAILLDNTHLDIAEQVQFILDHALKLSGNPANP